MKKLKFKISESSSVDTKLVPAKSMIPEWYKSSLPFMKGRSFNPFKGSKTTIKMCTPFFDSLTTGYILPLWGDLFVSLDPETGSQAFSFASSKPNLINSRQPEALQNFEIPKEYNQISLSIEHPLFLQTPKGYSVIISHPLNRVDLPFLALTGIVDTDKEPLFNGSYAFLIKKDFEGMIPKGTPFLQIIPFKRENWKAEEDKKVQTRGLYLQKIRISVFYGWYRKNAWTRKQYD